MELFGEDGLNMRMTRGDSESITIRGLPIVDGDIIYFTVKSSVNKLDFEFQKVVTSTTDGEIHIGILPSDTRHMKFKQYMYDIQLTRADKSVTTIVKPHIFIIDPEVTYD